MKKNQKGITLVALIITVVLLLIIATVTINEIDDKGIINYAQNTVNYQEIAIEENNIKQALLELQTTGNNLNDEALKQFIEKELGEGTAVVVNEEILTITMKTGNKYTATKSGDVKLIEEK